MVDKKLTGRIAADRIRMQSTPKPPLGTVERFLALGDCSGIISDVMDELGIPAGVVLRQNPQAGFQIAPGEPISLEVSR
jgi:hypothetical protein